MIMWIFILCLAAFLLWTIFNSFFMPSLPKKITAVNGHPLLSVLVPMRNEERNVKSLVASLKNSTYPNIEFIILNDQSTDRTQQLLETETGGDSRFTLLQGVELTAGWVGKVHACHQLQKAAAGELLMFVDADINFKPEAFEQSIALMQQKKAKSLSGFPAFEVAPFLSKLLVPMQHFVVFFHLPLGLANYASFPAATAAHGAWMLFDRKTYDEIGGHHSVHNSLVEDVHISREIKKAGHRMLLANITESVSSKMYDTNKEVWEGFLKNSYTGIGRSSVMAVLLTLFYVLFYVIPFALAVIGIFMLKPLFVIPYLLICLQQLYVMLRTRQNPLLAILMPFQAGAMIAVLLHAMQKSRSRQSYSWKGRNYL
ncbi:glycosyltransferase [Planomicrobium okeanokoites]|uniref:glycosyltransferase n=1 Tax=Planomicrobium okeanokoites TaxID=244 RepID=UPI00248F51AA|nr:glycosyltransferase [Planomicrobium okeanokoites]